MIHINIQIDGIDKTGKDLILQYVTRLSNHKYVIQSRGLISQIAYSKIYNRNYEYRLDNYKDTLFIYLYANEEDLKIRHTITNEPKIDIKSDLDVFNSIVNSINNILDIHSYNTSEMTPYAIAKCIINLAEEKEKNYV